MKEAMEKAEFMNKAFALAKASRQYVERLWKIGIDVSRFSTSIANVLSSFFDALSQAATRVSGFSKGIREFSLTRFIFVPPFDLWFRRVTSPEEEYFPAEMGRANVSFLFNVTVAKKPAAELARRVAAKTPKPALLPRPASLPRFAPLPEAGAIEETVEGTKEPATTVPQIIADLQSRFESKLTPIIKGPASALREYSRQAILLAPLMAMPKPFSVGPTGLKSPQSYSLVAPPEKESPQIRLQRPLAVTPRVPSAPHREAKVEPAPPLSILAVRLRPEVARSFRYATELPSVVLEQELRILERERPILKVIGALSLVSALKQPPPRIEPPYHFPEPTALPPMHPSQIAHLIEEVSPSLTSWIYGISEVLRGTSLSLSAVPVAASTAERVVMETLIQPVSSLEAPRTLGVEDIASPGLKPSKPEAGFGHIEVEAFRLPAIVGSLVATLTQRYPLLFSEPTIGETGGAPFGIMQAAPEEAVELGRMAEVKRVSKLPTVIALAAAESLIAQRLQRQFGALMREMQIARSSYEQELGELDTFGPIRTTMLGKLAAAAPTMLPTLEPYAPGIPSTPPQSTRASVSPTIQNTFNITMPAESTEEDLGDLERKISRILSEQMRRYYGSTRI